MSAKKTGFCLVTPQAITESASKRAQLDTTTNSLSRLSGERAEERGFEFRNH